MVAYGILPLPLIRCLKEAFPDVNQPWYCAEVSAGAKFKGIQVYFKRLQVEGPKRGYIPVPSKSIIIVKEHDREVAKIYFKDLGFTVVAGSRYLGGFIGEEPDQQVWIQEKTASKLRGSYQRAVNGRGL
jgi:hypothetical protein